MTVFLYIMMNNLKSNTLETLLSGDQSLTLRAKVIEYVREALAYDKGYVVLEVQDLDSFEFGFYHTFGDYVKPRYDETRNEIINRIIYTIKCDEMTKYKNDMEHVNQIIEFLYNYCAGYLSANQLFEEYKIKDYSLVFNNIKEKK